MKKLSIKMRITLWYTLLMLVLVVLVLGFMLSISGSVVESDTKKQLTKIVGNNIDEVDYDDGELEIDDDFVFLKSSVYSLVYSMDGVLLAGQAPGGFSTDAAFQDGSVTTVTANGDKYYIYDRLVPLEEGEDLWIRGIVPAGEGIGVIGSIIHISFITLPLLVLLAAVGGYRIAKHSFRPIEQINRAADKITEGKDLSKRIDLGEGKDEIHQLANTFDRMFDRLEISFEAEKQFTSDASHELRTPTSVILAQCEYALNHANTNEEFKEALEVIQRQGNKMSRLIGQLLTFTRVEQGTANICFEETDISELVEMICEEQKMIKIKNISLHTHIDPDIYGQIDRSLMTGLLTNLISNAYRYGKENGFIFVELHQKQKEIILSVRDDGVGIAEEEISKIWQRFYQVNPSRTSDETGSMGLGLAMVKQVAELHNGEICVESTIGKGSTFIFNFPQNAKRV